ncbi:hypothetical protein [Amycolatopsis sp. cmx-11-51]|uniref:hypothetical protein n=1 Tax=Amycolatopsis sp. cmx-11-51 TaxID=2785797 RepID=UPI0039E661AA
MVTFCLVVAAILLLAGVAWAAYSWAHAELEDDRGQLDAQREVLKAEWLAMEQNRKVNEVYFSAREALRDAEHRDPPRRWPS